MKIAFIGTRGVPANYGGFETCAEELSVGLTQREHEIYVYCRRNNTNDHPSEFKSVHLIYMPHFEHKYLSTFTHSLFSVIHSIFQPYDIILAFNVGIAPFCLILRLMGKQVLLNVDGLEWKRKKWNWIGKKYFKFCELIAGYTANKLITDSKAIQSYYLNKYHVHSIFIPYGAHISDIIDKNIINEYHVKENEYFFVASRLEPENNADLIVEAFKMLKTSKKLLIAGGANYQSTFIQKLLQTNHDRIIFLGSVYKSGHIRALHRGCYAYIHGNEVGGTNPALLKAMGYGNCILALNVPCNVEVTGKGAILFEHSKVDLANKMKYILEYPRVMNEFKIEAINRVKRYYSWSKIIIEYEKLFRSLLKIKMREITEFH